MNNEIYHSLSKSLMIFISSNGKCSIVPEKEKALRVCDESYKPVVESELWVFRQALDILGCAPINEFFSREA